MFKAISLALMLTAGTAVAFGASESPDVFAGLQVQTFAKRVTGKKTGVSQISSFVGDQNAIPKTVFYAGDTICWWTTGITTPKGTGPVGQSLSAEATTPSKVRTFSGDFTICNTTTLGTCDNIPDYTIWTLGVCVGPLPGIVDRVLQQNGPVPFSSIVSGTGYVSYVHSLTGNSVAPIPTNSLP